MTPRAVGQVKWWRRLSRETRELATRDPRNLPAALSHARAGFYPSSTAFYPLDGPEGGDYVSDRQKELTWGINWPSAQLLDDKLAFFFMLQHFEVPTPEVLGIVVGGRLGALSGNEDDGLRGWLEQRGRLVVRPTRGADGREVWIVDLEDDVPRINGERVSWSTLDGRVGTLEDHIVSEFVEQARYARQIFPGTTNTIRVLTLRDGDAEPFIATATHRFGAPASAPADNWSRGGLAALVDLETGRLSAGVPHPRAGELERHDVHPASQMPISGVQVPRWPETREGLLQAARQMSFFPYVGWDIVVTEDGFQVIEGNKYTDVHAMQVHQPLMRDERVRRFYQRLDGRTPLAAAMPTDATLEPAAGQSPTAVVRLPGVSPRAIGQVKWWLRLARETSKLARSRRLPSTGVTSAVRLAGAGFTPSSSALYGLKGDGRRQYLSDRERELTWIIDWPAAGLLDDKLAFFFMLEHLGVPTPRVRGVILGGRVHPLDGEVGSPDWMRALLENEGRPLVVRPTRLGAGQGVWIVTPSADGCRVNEEPVGWDELRRRLRGLEDHIVSEFVNQASYSRAIFPGTTNTLRIITAKPDERPPLIAAAVHRFGSDGSGAADNWSQGGLMAGVDVDTGLLGQGAVRTASGGLEWLQTHPSTGARLEGTRVTNWARVRQGVLACAAKLPYLPYVGWDVVVTDTGWTMIEGNKFPDVTGAQIHQPLLANPAVRAFYAEHGVLTS